MDSLPQLADNPRLTDSYVDGSVLVIRTEEARADTRADVVVYGRGWTLLIEAKIYATEQKDQGSRLEAHWSNENPTMVFLTRTGRPMTTGSAQWIPYRWSEIALRLRQALQETSNAVPGRARGAAEEYLRGLEAHLS